MDHNSSNRVATIADTKYTQKQKDRQIVLVLQGGGALGAYQAGVYHALHEHAIEPDWIVGTSIGAINASLIAGNPHANRLEALKEFWTRMAYRPAFGAPARNRSMLDIADEASPRVSTMMRSGRTSSHRMLSPPSRRSPTGIRCGPSTAASSPATDRGTTAGTRACS